MVLTPRFQPGATARPFVDREDVLARFDDALATARSRSQVLFLTGIGGIGKSRLLTELRARVVKAHPTALLDLQVPAQRQPENALAVLRAQFGERRIAFHRFDIAYAVLWQRLHPHLRISAEGLALVEHSEILTEILNEASGVPVFGTATRLIDAVARRLRRWRWIRGDPTLAELDQLSLTQLIDAVSYLFAEDLRTGTASSPPFVVFMDAYEALVGGVARGGKVAVLDAWLRDLVAQLSDGLVVLASREPPRWERNDPDWAARLNLIAVDDLPMTARDELLAAGGIDDPAERRVIALSSVGVPFYLHLAIDARRAAQEQPIRATMPAERLLERFLAHVEPVEVRVLELLSVPRVFDEEIFTRIAAAFGLPGHRSAWESITGYSFVYGSGLAEEPNGSVGGTWQLHQLMVAALRRRLAPTVTRPLHRLLREVWDSRSATSADRLIALREAAYHGLQSGDLRAGALLGYVDRITACGGKRGVDGILADLTEHLSVQPDQSFEPLAGLLQIEAALLLGDAEGAEALSRSSLTSGDAAAGPGVVADRLAVAGANALRMVGRTEDALAQFTAVWERGSGSVRLEAGLWAADLQMCQGRLRVACAMAAQLRAACPPHRHEFLGDVSRLLCLGHRFAFDLDAALQHLDEAAVHYRAAGTVIGTANLATNRAELLALTDPVAALSAAGEAIELNRELGAAHELGKAYTALGVTRLMLAELDEAGVAFGSARNVLDGTSYRSGRARAELFQAILLARRGRRAEAIASARWAVVELRAAAVYPTLVLAAQRLLELIGADDPTIARAAETARAEVDPLPDQEAMDGVLSRLAGLDHGHLYAVAGWRRGSVAAGFYNDNVRIDTADGPVLVRIPVAGADAMDLRIWPESEVLRAVAPFVPSAPALRWSSTDPPFQIHEFCDGQRLDALAPRGRPVPDHVIADLLAFFAQLASVPLDVLPTPPDGWPTAPPRFAGMLSAFTQAVFDAHRDAFAALFDRLGIPSDPIAPAVDGWSSLRSRPFRLVHADVHRKNLIVTESVGRSGTVVIDWELALWGDPLYDLATHLHKMAYLPKERESLLTGWVVAEPAAAVPGWEDDLDVYLRHERVKSAVVDSIRYAKLIRSGGPTTGQTADMLDSLVAKLRAARAVWGSSRDLDATAVLEAITAPG